MRRPSNDKNYCTSPGVRLIALREQYTHSLALCVPCAPSIRSVPQPPRKKMPSHMLETIQADKRTEHNTAQVGKGDFHRVLATASLPTTHHPIYEPKHSFAKGYHPVLPRKCRPSDSSLCTRALFPQSSEYVLEMQRVAHRVLALLLQLTAPPKMLANPWKRAYGCVPMEARLNMQARHRRK